MKQPVPKSSGEKGMIRSDAMKPAFVIANGRPVAAAVPCSIEHFLIAQELRPRSVVVEHNGEPVERTRLGEHRLSDGDHLEVVRAVAGGA